mmetsp:Transcript_49054/g.122934  ORF Transcript_49054/g.122934 Transcript_49054/m.122934 type:complete len:87 (-) Transcript_49054:864-1124(-)
MTVADWQRQDPSEQRNETISGMQRAIRTLLASGAAIDMCPQPSSPYGAVCCDHPVSSVMSSTLGQCWCEGWRLGGVGGLDGLRGSL